MLNRQLSQSEFREAYAMLFESRGSLRDCVVHVRGLDQRSLKKAYRRKAHATHPDRAHLRDVAAVDPEAEFRAVVAAYELLRLVQQGDVEVALVAAKPATTRPAQSPPAPERSRADRPHDAGMKDRTAQSRPAGDRAEARRGRRAHRADQPFSAGAHYARWRGRADESPRPEGDDWAQRWREAARKSRFNAESAHFVEAPMPTRSLQIGQFLYYAGAISWRQLIDALVWQRKQRPLIGQLALTWGLLTREQISDVLQKRRNTGCYDTPFAEFALRCGYLTSSQHRALCGRAKLLQQRLGRYFVEQGILSEAQLTDYLRAMRLHNWRMRREAQKNG